MSTLSPGIIIRPPFGGQRCDVDREEVPENFAFLLRNWVRRNGKFIIRPGFTQIGTSLAEYPVGIVQYDHQSGHKYIVVATGTKWYKYSLITGDWVDITAVANPLTGGSSSHQLFRVFYKSNKAYIVGVNGHVDKPKCWDGVTDYYADVGGSPPKARCLAICNNRMLLGNTYSSQSNLHQVDVSAFNDFEDGWASSQTVNLMDTPGQIVAMCELGSLATAIYKTDAIYMATAQAAAEPFAFSLAAPMIKGPASPRCVVAIPGGHLYMAYDGSFWSFNGVSPTALPESFRCHVLQTANFSALNRSFGFYDSSLQEVWFIYQGRGSDNMDSGIIINISDMSAWPISFLGMYPTAGSGILLETATKIGDLTTTIGSLTDPIKEWVKYYERTMLCTSSGVIIGNGGFNDMGAAIIAELETGAMRPGLASDSRRQYFTAQESDHNFNKVPQTIYVKLGYITSGEEYSYTEPQVLNAGVQGPLILGHRRTSRAFALHLTITPSNLKVQWRGSVINGIPRGVK